MPRKTRTRKLKKAAEEEAQEKAAQGLAECQVVDCTDPALAGHDTPNHGKVWLCGNHDAIARRTIADEEAQQGIMDAIATPMEKAMAQQEANRRDRERARRIEPHPRELTPGASTGVPLGG